MQNFNSTLYQLGCRLIVVVFLVVYSLQVVGFEQFMIFGELEVLELNLDAESDGEENKSSEDLDDHLSQKNFAEQNIFNIAIKSSFFISESAKLAHLDPGYPPPELV